MKPQILALGFAAALALTTAPAAFAQPAAQGQTTMQPGTGPGMGPGMGMGRGMGRGMSQDACRGGMGGGMMGGGLFGMGIMHHPDGTLAYLKAELKITGKQDKAWDAFAASMRADADMMRATMQAGMASGRPATLAERLDRQEAMMTTHLQSLRDAKKALLALNDALDATQKEKLDDMAMPCRDTGPGQGMGGPGMGWGWQ